MNCFRLIIGLLTVVCSTFGATITINSSAANTNDAGLPTIEIPKHPAWADAFEGSAWVSTRASGDNTRIDFFEFLNGTAIVFSHRFDLPGVATGGSLSVRADDTSSVILNGAMLFPGSSSPGTACSAVPIGCLPSTTGQLTFADLQPHLVTGENVLRFVVRQTDGTAFGLNYSGSISYELSDAHAPEPASYALSAVCLLIAAVGARRRRARS